MVLSLQVLKTNPHSAFGILTVIISALLPIIGIFRPKPESSLRKVWRIVHGTVGYLAYITAMFCVFLAADHEAAGFIPTSTMRYEVDRSASCFYFLKAIQNRLKHTSIDGITSSKHMTKTDNQWEDKTPVSGNRPSLDIRV